MTVQYSPIYCFPVPLARSVRIYLFVLPYQIIFPLFCPHFLSVSIHRWHLRLFGLYFQRPTWPIATAWVVAAASPSPPATHRSFGCCYCCFCSPVPTEPSPHINLLNDLDLSGSILIFREQHDPLM